MKSSQGEYFVGLDHIRALAAFTVFTWHFNHVNDGHLSGPEIFPLSFFAEGHVGVAVFMTLSGYLFAKLLDGRDIHYVPFMWNRLLRLFPLLAFVFVVNGLLYHDLSSLPDYLRRLVGGFVRPLWPNGGQVKHRVIWWDRASDKRTWRRYPLPACHGQRGQDSCDRWIA